VAQARPVERPLDVGVGKQRFEFRAEKEIVADGGVVKRLDADPVARQHQSPVAFVPEGRRKHAPQPLETPRVPFDERLEHDFRVAVGMEDVAEGFEFAAKFPVVVHLAVKHDDRPSVVAPHRLATVFEVLDFQAHGGQRDSRRDKHVLLVRAAMVDRLGGGTGNGFHIASAQIGKTRESAHRGELTLL
jgi:hypothetical protein